MTPTDSPSHSEAGPFDLPESPWSSSGEQLAGQLRTDQENGLAADEAGRRLRQFGPNRARKFEKKSLWHILADQFKSLIVGLLAFASLISFAFGQWLEGVAIGLALLINALIGFFTELKATRSMEALHRLGRTTTKVRRGGDLREIDAEELVPGDLVMLEAGDLVPADLRLVEANTLQADEAALTGESMPVSKSLEPVAAETVLAERADMLFKGTAVTAGSGLGLVTATGPATEVGNIAALAQSAEEEITPLERRLAGLGRNLVWATAGIAIVVAVTGRLGGKDWLPVIKTAIAMAVAAVPEGLPIVATIAMARGVWRMAARNALVNRLAAVETLGSTSVIFTDKTGTLTENKLTVSRLQFYEQAVEAEFSEGSARFTGGDSQPVEPEPNSLLARALTIGVLCNNASLGTSGEEEDEVGDPLEISLLAAGEAAGFRREELLETLPEVREEAFSNETNMMATFHQEEDGFLVAVKGAPEAVLEVSSRVAVADGSRELGEQERQQWLDYNERMAADGLRMLALAEKRAGSESEEPYRELELLGLVGFLDPPRREIREILARSRRAGIRVVMVTGDHAATAAKVAQAIGLAGEESPRVVEGGDLKPPAELSEEEKQELLAVTVFARVNPEQKLNLIDLHQQQGVVVAMTGDGVNDAPALKKADIGIAMGRRGTQVAREASDMVLKDDRFATINVAVEHGRVIFNNIRKFIIYLLSGNISEVLIISLAGLAGAPLPLLPLQILYINLIGDVFPALGLGLSKGSAVVMDYPPRDPGEPVLTNRHWLVMGGYSLVIAASVLGVFALALTRFGMTEQQAISISFISLVLARLWHVFNMRDPRSGLFRNEVTGNPYVWAALAVGALLLAGAIYLPGLSTVLKVTPPDSEGWLLVLAASLLPLVAGQVAKLLLPGRNRQRG